MASDGTNHDPSFLTLQELNVIKTGGIHYKKADIHEVSVNIIGSTAILLNRIIRKSEVRSSQASHVFGQDTIKQDLCCSIE